MLNEKLSNALNEQVNWELYSYYLYIAMASYAEKNGMKGAANWLFMQAKEEMAHAIHMHQYILERGATPHHKAIEAPPDEYDGLKDVFEKIYAHEQKVTERINNIATLAMQENDHACYQFIMWYVNEQVEEESNDTDILSKLEMIGDDKGLLVNLDNELAARVYVNPFPTDAKNIG